MKKRREKFGEATYDLDELRKFIDKGNFDITRNCRREFSRLDYSDEAVIRIVKRLRKTEIYKTMPAKKKPDLMQDVYHTREKADNLYIKLQKSSYGDRCIIIQFKLA
ncbi:MAG: type II toxin-antitoxin system MqsR family toxin [Thermodesulfobacteriota bacterium]|nr:type II toxin-antitoxin system MqsR family toxin [Thermodesulfobacteriota bacterium]